MNKPYIICHMVMSIDGKVTGDFLKRNNHLESSEYYYQINREYQADAYMCGRVTMEESFTNKYYPNLNDYPIIDNYDDYIYSLDTTLYAVSLDPHGRLGWKTNRVIDVDHDPGYDNAGIIEVLTHQVDKRYLGYLQSKNISYIFVGDTKVDLNILLDKLYKYFNIKKILLEGGSIINGSFMEENLIDELSLVIDPVIGGNNDKPLFSKTQIVEYELKEIKKYNHIIWLNYIKRS